MELHSFKDGFLHVAYLFYMRPDDPSRIYQSQKHASDLNQANSPLKMTSYWNDCREECSIITCQFFNALLGLHG